MITVLLVNLHAEVIIQHYDTASEEEACRMMVQDWKDNKIIWEWEGTNNAFSSEFLEDSLKMQLEEFSPEYVKGVRHMQWYCGVSQYESDDEIVDTYFLHTNNVE